jgi:hypothetical protein
MKARLVAFCAVGAVSLLLGGAGAIVRYMLEAEYHTGDFGEITVFFWSIILWACGGIAIGLVAGAVLAARVARWVDSRNMK